jgi:hypothetical protein
LEGLVLSGSLWLRSAREKSGFSALAGSASEHWTVDAMLKRLEELRKEDV